MTADSGDALPAVDIVQHERGLSAPSLLSVLCEHKPVRVVIFHPYPSYPRKLPRADPFFGIIEIQIGIPFCFLRIKRLPDGKTV